MRLLIIRHADPDYGNNTITEKGHLEAQALAKRLASEKVNKIYNSPLGRAVDTMKYTADLVGLPSEEVGWAQELSWNLTDPKSGLKMAAWNLPGERLRLIRPYPNQENWHQMPYYQESPIYEDFEQLKQQSDLFLNSHGYERVEGLYRINHSNQNVVAVFCHGGFGLTWLSHLLELPLPLVWTGFWLPPSSVTTVLFEERSADWAVPRCIGMGDVSHLHTAGLPVQPSGLLANRD